MTVCAGADCGKDTTSNLQCPVCLKSGISNTFCDQVCFKSGRILTCQSKHKTTHGTEIYDPFPSSAYSGKLRAVYPLANKRSVRDTVVLPDYGKDGQPRSEHRLGRSTKIEIVDAKGIQIMRELAVLGREVLDIGAAAVKPGVTTEYIDQVVHEACMERNAYPSPLNYYNFPKSLCTSVNEVICHGIPDKRPLQDGDIVNLDVSLYRDGYHTDLNETYYVGDKAKADPDVVRLVETTREALELSIATVKPGVLFRSFGDVIEKHAKENGLGVVRAYCGHGINQLYHAPPNIPHYAKNKTPGIAKPGMVFTIEPMLTLGSYRDKMWPDNWTSATIDGKWSAQFEHTMLVTETGVEVLTARLPNSPGGAVPRIH